MKNIIKQIVRPLVAVVLFAQVANISAQNIIYEVPSVKSDNSIIREYKEDCYLVYNDISGTPTFGLADIANATYYEASMSVPTLVINDMEIVGKIAYFCGNDVGTTFVFFGFFDIPDVFFSGGAINYCLLPPLTMTDPPTISGYTENFTKLLRIEPFVLSSNDVHIFMVGESYYTAPSGASGTPYRCLIDAHYDGTTAIDLSTQEETGSVYFFDDIAVTSNHLVAVGDKHGGTGQYMNFYTLPNTAHYQYFQTIPPLSPNFYWSQDIEYYPVPEVRIESMGGDAFATVCKGFVYAGVGTNVSGIVLTTYNSAINMADRHLIDNPYDTKMFRDFKFNDTDSLLYYIPEVPYCISPDHLYTSRILAGYNIGAHEESNELIMPEVRSVDRKKGVKGAFASGISSSGLLNMWNVEMSASPCAVVNPLDSSPKINPEYNDGLTLTCNLGSPVLTSGVPSIASFPIIKICE